jgi:hypothetical protein
MERSFGWSVAASEGSSEDSSGRRGDEMVTGHAAAAPRLRPQIRKFLREDTHNTSDITC